MKKVDLNVDIGEGFTHDEELLRFATSASVCCGEHAGSWDLTVATIGLCQDLVKRIGMHPGYPDRPGMGRRTLLPHNSTKWNDSLVEQAVRFCGYVKPAYVKPHGAFYNDTALPMEYFVPLEPGPVSRGSSDVAEGESGFAASLIAGLPGGTSLFKILLATPCLMGLPGTMHEQAARKAGASFIREGFADRAYDWLGLLVPRSEPGAVLEDPQQIRQQVLELAPKVDSICLHGDTPNCLEFAELVFKTLVDAGYEVGY